MHPTANINAETSRSHNFRNALHTTLLVLVMAALLGLIAFSTLGIWGLVGASVVGAFMPLGIRRVSPSLVLKLYKTRPLNENELPELQHMMRQLAARANLPSVPTLHYVPTKMLNAFAVGRPEDSAIALSDGLLRVMNLRQLQGIIAHETAHIMNGDLKVMGMADVFNRMTSFMSMLGLLGVPLIFGTGANISLVGPFLMLLAPTIGGFLQMALSRTREYDADHDGATLTGDPEGLASALKTLEERNSQHWEGLVLPGSRLPQPSLLRTHPKTADRIARLMELRLNENEQIVLKPERLQTASIVPPTRGPKIHWHRMGIYF
jgi:heat shock protein HtpX